MLEARNGKVVEVTEVEVDVLAIKEKIATLRNIASTHAAEADRLEASLEAPDVKAVIVAEEAKVAEAKAEVEAAKEAVSKKEAADEEVIK